MAAIRALDLAFPGAEVKGCFFHFTQAVWRKTVDLGLAVAYKEDPAVQQWIRRAAALPLLPLADVQNTWVEVMEAAPAVPRAREFHDYIVVNWVDDDARFPPNLWNHFQTFGPRTNNNLEGFHSRLNGSLCHRHPNVYRLVNLLKKIEKAEKAKLAQLNFGAAPPSRKRTVIDCINLFLIVF